MSLALLAHKMRPPAAQAQGALVLMHGRGTSEHDLWPLVDVFDPRRRLVGLAPGGPLLLEPGGQHWYAVRRVGHPDPDSFHATMQRLGPWIAAIEPELGVPLERTILGGFSQGAVMAYALALGRGRRAPAGILALSGFIPTVEDYELDLGDRRGLRAAVAHGTRDEVIGVEWGRAARDALVAAGADVLYRESPVTHTLDPRELPTFAAWVRDTLPPLPPG